MGFLYRHRCRHCRCHGGYLLDCGNREGHLLNFLVSYTYSGSAFNALGTILEAIVIIATALMIRPKNMVFDFIICIGSKYNKIT